MVPIIRSALPNDYKVWIEGCLGSGAVSLNRDCPENCQVNIINELEPALYNFWKVLADTEQGRVLMDELEKLEPSRELFDKAHYIVNFRDKTVSDTMYALYTFLEVALSFNGLRRNYANSSENISFQRLVKEEFYPTYQKYQNEQMKVTNLNMLDILRGIMEYPEEVQRGIMVYLDPPYLFDLRSETACNSYKIEMPYHIQIEMLLLLQKVKCKIMLSGYFNPDCDLYSEHLCPFGYQCYFIGNYHISGSKRVGKEFLWCNYELPKGTAAELVDYECKLKWTA